MQGILAAPLCHIFHLSISERRIPERWKYSHVSPIPKVPKPQLTDLRPVSLLPLPSKIFEWCCLNDTTKGNFINNFGMDQFGVRPKCSASNALIKIYHQATLSLEEPEVEGVQIIAYVPKVISNAIDKTRWETSDLKTVEN